MTRILCLAPHTDDAELGAGGTLARFVEWGGGAHVYVAAFSPCRQSLRESGLPEDALEKEFHASMDLLGVHGRAIYDFPVREFPTHRQEILEEMVRLRKDTKPDLVLIPSPGDVHQDHHVIHQEALRCFKCANVWCYEQPWNQKTTTCTMYMPLTEAHLQKKWAAIAQYKSQMTLKRSYCTLEFVAGLARVRGVQAGCAFAEAFEAVRHVWAPSPEVQKIGSEGRL
ncbi:MAG: PIG-L family deacetylase [Holosporales bacterium]|jgi:LmbE family N-acetylglucosaminyl deacetylase|nr:PIG-L family deacetylase [Holosporales bacterium]